MFALSASRFAFHNEQIMTVLAPGKLVRERRRGRIMTLSDCRKTNSGGRSAVSVLRLSMYLLRIVSRPVLRSLGS